MVQALRIRGAQIWDHGKWSGYALERRDLFTHGNRISAEASPDALTVDLEGHAIFPGLINAHDHLELNHYPRSKFRERYDNAHQWGEDMNARLNDEPYRSLRAYPLEDRCFIGGLKNLLCGALTVAHHNPPHKCLFRKDFPVRVLREYGWAHSLHFNTAEEIVRSYRSTPKDWPWFIHLAEGTDEVAAGEYQRLKALGCVGENTVFVHAVGILAEDMVDAQLHAKAIGEFPVGHGSEFPVVWCPTTNMYLLGHTGHARMGWNTGVFIGSDSRLTADGDLLDEMRFAATRYSSYPDLNGHQFVVYLVTNPFFRWNGLENRLTPFHPKNCADFIVISSSDNSEHQLCNSRRADLALIIRGGVPQIGAPELMAKFPHVPTVAATLDGVPKAIHRDLAQRIHRCTLKEPGLEVEKPTGRRFTALLPWKHS